MPVTLKELVDMMNPDGKNDGTPEPQQKRSRDTGVGKKRTLHGIIYASGRRFADYLRVATCSKSRHAVHRAKMLGHRQD